MPSRVLSCLTLLSAGILLNSCQRKSAPPPPSVPAWNAPSPDATWPWPKTNPVQLQKGVTHWHRKTDDNTSLDLIRFDFTENPRLRFEMYDQDQGGKSPWSNHVPFYSKGVIGAVSHLERTGRGRIIAATNGLYWHATKNEPGGFASHVAPVVVDGKPHFANGENPRWAFGVNYRSGRPKFLAFHHPMESQLQQFDFASGGAQILIRDGQLAPSPAEAGKFESSFEAMRTSRIAWGWTKDNRYLYLLLVKEPDTEIGSKIAAKRHQYLGGGWMLSDVRTFFHNLGVDAAFNSDAGDVAQMLLRKSDGKFDFVPPQIKGAGSRRVLPGTFNSKSDPGGGALLYWYVRELPAS